MKTIKRGLLSLALAAAVGLTGCAKSPDDEETKEALSKAVAAELEGRPLSSMPNNKSIATNMKGGRQFIIARKTDNVPEDPDCAEFDITVSRPSVRFSLFGGDSDWKKGVIVCLPR